MPGEEYGCEKNDLLSDGGTKPGQLKTLVTGMGGNLKNPVLNIMYLKKIITRLKD